MNTIGLIRTASVTPKLKVADTKYNLKEILSCTQEADHNGAGVILFPELALTGYTCGDLFYQEFLYQQQLDALKQLTLATRSVKAALIIGFYLRIENNYYNCAALLKDGRIAGIVPKMFMPNAKEFYEARWFASGIRIADDIHSVDLFGEQIPFGHILFCDRENELNLGIEICEDLWVPISPGAQLALAGAHILFNPSASNETVGKAAYRKNLVLSESAKRICGYVYTSSGVHESTTDLVFSGAQAIVENGSLLAENTLFQRESSILYGEIDYARIRFERTYGQNFEECTSAFGNRQRCQQVLLTPLRVVNPSEDTLYRRYSKNPFLPSDPAEANRSCREIFQIQAAGLAKRMEHTGAKKAVLGISGGLDSTLALLVCAETMKLLKRPSSDIIAITMPGFGTTGKTYNNALTIMRLLGADIREISIKSAVLQHFEDIGHDPAVHDVTYENAQARERTQILMDAANQEGGLVVGTGDLSEAALGWSTYNGDHMSMYGVNASVPKTLIRFVIHWVMDHRLAGADEDQLYSRDNALLRDALQDIIDTPISPELLPPSEDGSIAQKTEDTVGPYILHDFFLYHTIRYGTCPEKLIYLAKTTFSGEYDETFIRKWLAVFYRRFFSQQFKRSCAPDGPKVGSVSLSPRGDWRMPSDASAKLWLDSLNNTSH